MTHPTADPATRPIAQPYEYVVLRCVPRVDREEFLNVGVLLHCRPADFLALAWHVEATRLQAVDPALDVARVCAALEFLDGVCRGEVRGGIAAQQSISQRFGFAKAPRSTVVQPGPVHGGVTTDPATELTRLAARLLG